MIPDFAISQFLDPPATTGLRAGKAYQASFAARNRTGGTRQNCMYNHRGGV